MTADHRDLSATESHDAAERNPLEDTTSTAALAYAEERRDNIRRFVRTNPD